MKKIIPILAVLTTGAVIFGTQQYEPKLINDFENNIQEFSSDVDNLSMIDTNNLNNTILNKYKISLLSQDTLTSEPNITFPKQELQNETQTNNEHSYTTEQVTNSPEITQIENETDITSNEQENTSLDNNTENSQTTPETANDEQISTLYSLSNDVEESCDEFCALKENLNQAIEKTKTLIEQIQNNQIEISDEQRMFIIERARDLKTLGKQLSSATTQLSLSLSDLRNILATENVDFDTLSIKYLMLLDSLSNDNELLENGLNSLNLINSIFYMQSPYNNNPGRVLYGFKRNNEPPIIKDYTLDENNNLTENNDDNENNNEQDDSETNSQQAQSTTNAYFAPNIDTYGNPQNNLDTFFNTALYNDYYNNQYMNPYMYNPYMYNNFANGRTPNNQAFNNMPKNPIANAPSINNQTNLPTTENEQKDIQTRHKPHFNFNKNIDTYRNEELPNFKDKLNSIKTNINTFINKLNAFKNNK